MIERQAAAVGLALRGGFHVGHDDDVPVLPDGRPAATVLMLGWTGGVQWPVFAASPEFADARAHPLDRWSRRVIGQMAAEWRALALYPFGGPPFRPFLRWAVRAEAVHASPLALLIHPDWGLWHAWRGALAFADWLALPERDSRSSPCENCPGRPCLEAGSFDVARRACPVGTAYGAAQTEFHAAAFEGRAPFSSGKSSPG